VLDFALNHITVAGASYAALIDIAARLGCVGVEVRNDLGQPLFDGMAPEEAGAMARDKGLRILSVAEVTRFTAMDEGVRAEAQQLIRIAAAVGGAVKGEVVEEDQLAVFGEGDVGLDLFAAHIFGAAERGHGVFGRITACAPVGDDAEGIRVWHFAQPCSGD